jgi:hypothetical protein
MASHWQPVREPLRSTLLRNCTIAVVAGAVIAHYWGGLARWPLAALLGFWPAFGGHWVEIWFLNWLRPRIGNRTTGAFRDVGGQSRISATRAVQVGARIAVWFVGGIFLATGMVLTAMALARYRPGHWPAWWLGGICFIGIELVAHVGLQLRGQPSFYNGLG